MEAVLPALDHLSFVYDVPVFVTIVRVFDSSHQTTHIVVVSPYRSQVVVDSINVLFIEMRPVYSMYREAKAASSDFYRFLCLYKIMEGLFGTMASSAYKKAKMSGIQLEKERPVVPNDSVVPGDLRQFIGTSIQMFFQQVLTKQFRNAVAHLQTKSQALNVSSPVELERFAGLALVTDLCAREAISCHERLLMQLNPSMQV